MKKYILIAGVNGAGKTTFYSSEEEAFKGIEKINLDEEVRAIGNWKNLKDVVEAGKRILSRINGYFEKGISFSQETTLCGNSILKNIQRAKKLGYTLEVYYVGVESPEIAIERVNHRVSLGGHGISEEDIRRRYDESLKNLQKVLPLFEKVYFYDNTEDFVRVASYAEGAPIWKSKESPKWLNDAII